MALQLSDPKWAMMTAFIVAQPISGMVMAKGVARLAGTLVAATVGITLIAWFGQTPILFSGALALWLAICVACATFFRNFRSYAFVLSGYTAVIIAAPALQAPDTVFSLAVSRGTEITIGIACAGLSSLIFSPGVAGRAYFRDLNDVFASVGAHLGELAGLHEERDTNRLKSLIGRVLQLESLRGYARFDTPGFRARDRLARRLDYELISLLTATFTVEEHLMRDVSGKTRLPERVAAREELQPAARLMTENAPPFGEGVKQALTQAYDRILARAQRYDIERSPSEWIAISRLLDLANRLKAAVVMHTLLTEESEPERQPRPRRFSTGPETGRALRNAGRAFITVVCTCAIWIHSGTRSGLIAVILVSVFSTLFATRDNPIAALGPLTRGVAFATVVGFGYAFLILPALSDFPMLALTLFPILFFGSLAMGEPRTAGTGTVFLIILSVLLNLDNTGRPHAATYLNDALGMGLAIGVVFLAFLLLWPSGPRITVHRLLDGVFSDLAAGFSSPRHHFETRMYDRLVRLMPHLDTARAEDADLLQGALAAVTIGMEGRRLSGQLRSPLLPAAHREKGLGLLSRLAEYFTASPARTADLAAIVDETVRFSDDLLYAADPLPDHRQRRLMVRTGVTARIIATALEHNADFFQRRGRVEKEQPEATTNAA